jgi:hypothetical protein
MKLNNLHPPSNIVRTMSLRRMRSEGLVARVYEMNKMHRILFGKREVKRPVGRSR